MIKEMLLADLVITDAKASNWKEAVYICGNILVKHKKIDNSYICSMVNAVKEFGSYMVLIPKIALFHGRPNEGVNEISLSLVTFKEAVKFDDDKSIKAAFAFAAVDNESHLKMLSQLVQLLQNDEFLALLRNNGSKEEIMNIIKKY